MRNRLTKPFFRPTLILLGYCFGNRAKATLSINGQFYVEVPVSDTYWIAAGFEGCYEPELLKFLDGLPAKSTLFIDCGANIGWWSLLAEKRWGWTCIAIEASCELARTAEANRAANAAAFIILRNAVWKSDGDAARFKTGFAAHAGGHLASVPGFVADWRVNVSEDVTTVSIDSIIERFDYLGSFERTILKLDVEGAEVEAMEGAQKALHEGAYALYEDHGRDLECAPTAAALRYGLAVYSIDDALTRIRTVRDALAQKEDRSKGYNFVAVAPETAGFFEIESLIQARNFRTVTGQV